MASEERLRAVVFSTTEIPRTKRNISLPFESLFQFGRNSKELSNSDIKFCLGFHDINEPHKRRKLSAILQEVRPVILGDLPASVKARKRYMRYTNAFLAIDRHSKGSLKQQDLLAYTTEKSMLQEFVTPSIATTTDDISSGSSISQKHFRHVAEAQESGQRRACKQLTEGGEVTTAQGLAKRRSEKRPSRSWVHLVAGALAGGASRSSTAPLEVLRLQAITGTHQHRRPLNAAKQIVAQHGWRGLYRGNMLNVVRAVPQKALDFFSFEIYKEILGADKRGGMGLIFMAAAMAGATSTVVLHPLEVIRSRLTVDMSGHRRGLVAATSQMVQHEGLGSLYKGLLPSIMAIIPEAAITYGMFDWLKTSYAQRTGQEEAGMLPSIACGVLSSFTGQMVAFPLESIARRLQVQKATAQKMGILTFVQEIIKREGALALYRGSGAAVMKVIPMAAISFSTYEIARLWLTRLEATVDDRTAGKERHSRAEQF